MNGVLLALICASFSSAKDLMSKKVSFNVDGTVSSFASFAFALPFYALALVIAATLGWESLQITAGFGGYVIARSLTDVCAEWCKMNAFSRGDLSLVVLYLSLTPLLLLVTSPLVTGDPLTVGAVLSSLLVVSGSIVIAYRPNAREAASSRKAICFALLAALFFSLNACFDRLAVKNGSPLLAGLSMTSLAALLLFPLMFSRRGSFSQLLRYRRPFFLRGFFEIGFMVAKLSALQFMSAPLVDSVMRLSVVFSIVAGRFYFAEQDFARRLFAGFLVTMGSVVVALQWL